MVGLLFLFGIISTCNDMGTIVTQYIVLSREKKKKQKSRNMGTNKQIKSRPVLGKTQL